MASRLGTRTAIVSRALSRLAASAGRRRKPTAPRRILIAHHLLLGDTLMLTPLIAKLRMRYPEAEIVMTTPKAIAPLYEKRPYGLIAWPFDPRVPATVAAMFERPGFDLAVVPGDNRHSWLAAALGAQWIVAHGGAPPRYRSWPVDELIGYPDRPAAWGDTIAELVDGQPPALYDPKDWPAPSFAPFTLPDKPYAVLHVGASSSLKFWEPRKWLALASHLANQGLGVIWSGGGKETGIVKEIDQSARYQSYAAMLDLPQLWQLVRNASLLICPDTGVAHLGRIVGTPTVALFGPGSSILSGAGAFWGNSQFKAASIEPFPCRDQHRVFNREVRSLHLCRRTTSQCKNNLCMQAITVDMVVGTISNFRTVIDPKARLL